MLDLRCVRDCQDCLTVLLGNAMKNHTGELFSRLGIEWLGSFIHYISTVNVFLNGNCIQAEKGKK